MTDDADIAAAAVPPGDDVAARVPPPPPEPAPPQDPDVPVPDPRGVEMVQAVPPARAAAMLTAADEAVAVETPSAATESVADAAQDGATDDDAPAAAVADAEAKPKKKRKKKEAPPEPEGPPKNLEAMDWYILKVQSNREDSIAANIVRRLKIAGLDQYVDRVEVPIERKMEIKDGKKKVVKHKLYPGYVCMHMEMHAEPLGVIRDTPGVGHFLGADGKALPMPEEDKARLLAVLAPPAPEGAAAGPEPAPKPAIEFQPGDRVVIKDGAFENFEGDVEEVNEAKGLVRVVVQVFGRPNPVYIEYWHLARART